MPAPRLSIIFFVFWVCWICAACNQKQEPSPATATAATTEPDVVTVSPELSAQLKLEAVKIAPVADTLRIAARVEFDEQRLARIGASVTGRVTQVYARLGQQVNAGTVLAELNSSELSTAQLSFLKTRAQKDLLQRNLERARHLFENDVISHAELQRRESEYQIAAAENRAAQDQLRVLGMSLSAVQKLAAQGSINSGSAVVATSAGTVVERKITPGEVVQPTDALFTIADLSRLWVIAQIPEQQAGIVQRGQKVMMEIPALGNEQRSGQLIYVGETVNPETRTVVVRTAIDNTDARLKPAMLATMLIAGTPVQRVVIPGSATVRDGDNDYVFVSLGNHRYRLTAVQLGPETAGERPVLSGLDRSATIVVDGAFHLNNEYKRQQLGGT